MKLQAKVASAPNKMKEDLPLTGNAKARFELRTEVLQRRRACFDVCFRSGFVLPVLLKLRNRSRSLQKSRCYILAHSRALFRSPKHYTLSRFSLHSIYSYILGCSCRDIL